MHINKMVIRKLILKGILILVILSIVGLVWCVNKFLSPANLKAFFLRTLSESINRPVTLEDARLSLTHGVSVTGLAVYEPDGKKVFLKAGRIWTMPLFIPIITERRIIIPSINVESLTVNIEKKQDKSWNLLTPELFKKDTAPKKSTVRGFSFLIRQVKITKGEIDYSDNARDPVYARQMTNIHGTFALSLKEKGIVFKVTSLINSPSKTLMGIEGIYLLEENRFISKVALKNLAAAEFYEYFYKGAIPINLKDGVGDATVEIKLDSDKNLALSMDSSIKGLDISALGLVLKGDVALKGEVVAKLIEGSEPKYKIVLDMKGPTLSGVQFLNEVTKINGAIDISNDAIYAAGLIGYAYNTPIELTGGVDLKTFKLRLAAEAALDLANYHEFLPADTKEAFKNINIQGPSVINVKFYDNLKDPQPGDLNGKIKLQSVTLALPDFKDKFEKISGELLFTNESLYISRTSFNYGASGYLLDSKIMNLKSPDVRMKLKNKDITLTSRFQLLKDRIHILRLSGNYLKSTFTAAGNIERSAEQKASLNGKAVLELTDLRKTLPAISEPLTRFNIRGACNLDFSANGPLKDLAALDLTVKGRSEAINFWDLKLTDVTLELKMKDKHLFIPELSARPYGGLAFSSVDVDLAQANPPYAISLSLEDIDLSKLILDTDLKNKRISGKGLLKANIRGFGKNSETVKGEGYLFIKGGSLWEVPLLKGIGDLLFMPNLSSIVFDEVSSHFTVAGRAVSTSDLKLHSQSVGLLAEGSVFFNGALDFMVTTSISENFLKGTSEFERLAGALLAEAGQLVGRIKVGGTIKNTEYKFMPFPIDKILKDKIKGLLGGFF